MGERKRRHHEAQASLDGPHLSDGHVHDFEREASLGTDLRIARERHGYELGDVARDLRIRQAYLQALEDGRFKDLPGAAYATGFLRTYAEHLGLEPEQVLRRFKDESSGAIQRSEFYMPKPVPEGRIPGGAILLLAMVLAGGVYGGWYYLTSTGRDIADLVPPVPERLAAALNLTPVASTVVVPVGEEAGSAAVAQVPEEAPAEAAPVVQAAAVTGTPATETPVIEAPAAETPGLETPAADIPAAGGTVLAQPAEPASDPVAVARTEPAGTAPAAATEPQPPVEAASPEIASPGPEVASSAASPVAAASEPPAPEQPAVAQPAAGPDVTTALAAPAPVAEPAPPATAEPVPAAQQTPVQQPPAEQPPAQQTAALPPAPPPAPAAEATPADGKVYGVVNGSSRIQLRATQDSWVQVRNAAGDLLFARVLRPGDVYRVPDETGLRLVTGNAGGVVVVVDGVAAAGPMGQTGQVMRDVALDPTRLGG